MWRLEISDRHTEKRREIVKMSKYYIIIAHNGTEVIDNTVQAEDRIATITWRADIKGNADVEITHIADLQRIHYSD